MSKFSTLNFDENRPRTGSMAFDRDAFKYGREAFCGDISTTRLRRLGSQPEY